MSVTDDKRLAAAKTLAAKLVAQAGPPRPAARVAARGGPPRPARATPTTRPDGKAAQAQDYADLFNGFNALVNSAVKEDGKTLDSLRFAGELKPADRTFLEHIRRVFIDAQAGAQEHKKAVAAWPAIEAKLHQAVSIARGLGVRIDYLDSTEDNIAAIAEGYIRAPHKGPSEMENAEDYRDLLAAIEGLLTAVEKDWTDMTDGVRPLNKDQLDAKQRTEINAVKFGTKMSTRHRELAEKLRHAFTLARTDGRAHDAVAAWNHINQDLTHVLKRIAALGFATTQPVADRLNNIHRNLIEGSAYAEDHQKARAQGAVRDPNDTLAEEKLKEAVQAVEKADELVKKGEELTSKALLQGVFEQHGIKSELIPLLFEYVHGGGEILELVEEWKKKSLIGKAITVADLADKMFSVSHTALEITFTYIKEFAEGMAKETAEDLAKEWRSIGKWADENLEAIEKSVGRVALVITIAVSAIKVVNHLIHGRVGQAVKEAASTAIGIGVGAAAGAAGTAFFAGIAFGIETEIEGLKGAAAMIEWAREENQALALGAFFATLKFSYEYEGEHLVADLKVLAEATDRNERKIAEGNLASEAAAWAKTLTDLSHQVNSNGKDRMGGQPHFLEKLGREPVNIMRTGRAASTPDGMGEQIRTVFAGANQLAKWVAGQRAEKHEAQERERREAEEEEKE
jgi:hypothetical protein